MKKLLLLLLLLTTSCTIEEDLVRVGAICNDGTITTSTGWGTCSSHGGVKSWIYGEK